MELSHRSTLELERAIRDYIDVKNRHPRPFVWTKSLTKSARLSSAFASESLGQDTSNPTPWP